ncbi:MAG: zinc ribbon domain-containing protein, partial [Oscillospiraceae bacterium]|nr:zinc ribbon domain-containing protein [Oscillospiraceae bacterium]
NVSKTRKQLDLKDKEIVLAPHEGIVSSEDWVKCRIRCLNNRQSTQTYKGKTSWLTGKVKCGKCGYGLTIVKAQTKWHRYFVCATSLATKKAKCKGTGGTIYADVLEEYIFNAIKNRLTEFKTLSGKNKNQSNPKINENKIRLSEIENEINDFLSKVVGANTILMEYINDKIDALDRERKELHAQILSLENYKPKQNIDVISNHVDAWEKTSYEDKQSVVDAMIKVIHIADGNIEIQWNI